MTVDFGCGWCADDQNRWFGHVTQLASNDDGMLLIECPRCDALYEISAIGEETVRLTRSEAHRHFPEW